MPRPVPPPSTALALRLLLAAALVLALAAWDIARRPQLAPAAAAPWTQGTVDACALRLQARGQIPMPPQVQAAHASNLLAMPASSPALLSAFWFAGTHESAPDVRIAASQFDRATQQWLPARFVLDRHEAGRQLGLGLRRLGNPVAWMDAEGRMHLFVVATGLGGWAASRIVHLRQSSASNALADLRFEPLETLPLSWFWNLSYLVRNPALPLADGGMLLPVHFELGLKVAAALRFDAHGSFVGMVRLSQRDYLLQPTLLARSATEWLAFFRNGHGNGPIAVVRTQDGGQHWSDAPDLALDNPDSAIAALALGPQQMLLAHNPNVGSRATLDLRCAHDGQQWNLLQHLEQGQQGDEYSYPALLWQDGQLWVSYTDQRKFIAWARFAPAGAAP